MTIKNFFIKYGTLIKNNLCKAWIILFCIWLIDFGSTILAVGLHSDVFAEGNPVAAWFFNLGLHGWFIWAICCGTLIWILLMLPQWSMKINLKFKKSKKDMNRIKFTFNIAQVSFFCFLALSESLVIIHNLYLLSVHLFV